MKISDLYLDCLPPDTEIVFISKRKVGHIELTITDKLKLTDDGRVIISLVIPKKRTESNVG
jgi:hypothetical protein